MEIEAFEGQCVDAVEGSTLFVDAIMGASCPGDGTGMETEPGFITGATVAVVTETGTSEHGTTVQLSLALSAAEQSVYTIYASVSTPAMSFPAAFNSGLGGDVGVSPVIAPEDAYDSWLTVGDVSGDAISSLGINFAAWSTDSLTITNGVVFWMNPADPGTPSGTALIAQLTIAGGSFSATINAQDLSADGSDDWQQLGIVFSW